MEKARQVSTFLLNLVMRKQDVIKNSNSSRKEIEEEIKRILQEREEDDKQAMMKYQAFFHELDQIEQEAKRDGLYDDVKENIERVRKSVMDGYNELRTQNQTNTEVGIDALEVKDFYNIDTKSNCYKNVF